ncbi:MAG: hypothetical protein KDI19_13785, partial [Pseudomonadales bacterium]|nr:hypothetical protein [Pseudomonadales bacterium]
VAPWLFLVFHAQGWEFFAAFFGKHNLGRFTGTMEGHGGSLFYYVYVFPFVILPFTGLLVVLATRWRKLVRDPLGRFCLTWFAVVLLIFSFSNTQLPHYVLNAVVPLAILCAREALARVSPMVLAVPALFLFLIIGLAISVGSGLINANEHVSAMLLLGREVFDTSWLVSAGVALALVLLVVFLPRVSTWQKLVLSGFVQNAFVFSLFVPAVAGMQQQPVKDAAMIARTLGRPIVAYAIHMPSFSVYRDAITPHRMPGEGEIVFTRNDRVAELRERLAGQNLGAQPIFAKGAIRLLLVHPLSSPKESEVEALP